MIVVGHHDFADDLLEKLPLEYDFYGMRFGYNDRLCVLNASRRALKLHNGGEGRDAFDRYYNKAVSEYPELAKKYDILPTFDHSKMDTKDFQYDLLWLEFVKYGLGEFLDID